MPGWLAWSSFRDMEAPVARQRCRNSSIHCQVLPHTSTHFRHLIIYDHEFMPWTLLCLQAQTPYYVGNLIADLQVAGDRDRDLGLGGCKSLSRIFFRLVFSCPASAYRSLGGPIERSISLPRTDKNSDCSGPFVDLVTIHVPHMACSQPFGVFGSFREPKTARKCGNIQRP